MRCLCGIDCRSDLALQARDLAAASRVCGELRNLSRSDALWEALYQDEFSRVPSTEADTDVSRYGGWAAAFAARWKLRKERLKMDSNTQLRPRMPTGRIFLYPHGGGAFPAPPPPGYLPGSFIGGDYDRLPSLGQGVMGHPGSIYTPSGGQPFSGPYGYHGQGGMQSLLRGSNGTTRGGVSHLMGRHNNTLNFN
jgi:hypothetical protein